MYSFHTWICISIIISLLSSCKKASQKNNTETMEQSYFFYQQGFTFQEHVQFQQALEAYRQAINLGIKVKDSTLLFNCYLQTCRIYRYQSLKKNALSAGKQAANYTHGLQSDSLLLILNEELGDIYALSGQADSAAIYYNRASHWKKLTLLAIKANNYNQAKKYLQKEADLSGGKISDDLIFAFTRMFLLKKQPDSATVYLSSIAVPNWQSFSYQVELSRLRGDTLQAAFYQKYLKQQHWASENQKNQAQIAQLQSEMDNFNWEKRLEKEQVSNRRFSYLWSIILFTGVAGGFFFIQKYRNKREIRQTETTFRNSEIYIRFHRKEEWKPKTQDWEELLHAFQQTYPGYYERLKIKIPQLTQSEWYMCCLIKIEVPPSIMAMLLCCTYQAISMRRTRLYQKITGEKGTPEQFDIFVRDI